MELTDNLNIVQFKPLITPEQLKEKLALTNETAHLVAESRRIIQAILTNVDRRRIAITGPCSLHDALQPDESAFGRPAKVDPVTHFGARLHILLDLFQGVFEMQPGAVGDLEGFGERAPHVEGEFMAF